MRLPSFDDSGLDCPRCGSPMPLDVGPHDYGDADRLVLEERAVCGCGHEELVFVRTWSVDEVRERITRARAAADGPVAS